MVKLRIAFLGLLVLISVICHAKQDEIKTALGIVEVQSSTDSSPDTIKVDGKTAYFEEGMYIGLYEKFSLTNEEVVLFGVNCGGTGCPNDDLHFLILRRGEKPKVVSDDRFSSSDETVKPRLSNGKIIIELGYENGKRKIAKLSSDKILIDLVPQRVSPMKLEDCKWLYETMSECMLRAPDCKSPSDNFSGATMRGVAALSNHPGFVSKGFDAACITACKLGKEISFDEYRKTVCSMKVPVTAKKNIIHGTVVTKSSSLNLRKTMDKESEVIAKLPKNSSVNILKVFDAWYEIQLSDGMIGYASKEYINVDVPGEENIDSNIDKNENNISDNDSNIPSKQNDKSLQCGTKSYCKQMTSCEEAEFYLNTCGLKKLDRDGDGIPCENVCR